MMWGLLMHILLMPHVFRGVNPEAPLHSAAPDLPWQDELCCDSPPPHIGVEGSDSDPPEANLSNSNLPYSAGCRFVSEMMESRRPKPPAGTCLDIVCRPDETWLNLTCHVNAPLLAGCVRVSLQRLPVKNGTEVNDGSDKVAVCAGEDSLMCSINLDPSGHDAVMVTINVSNAEAPSVMLRIPEKPSPPFNLSHTQSTEGHLILDWIDPSDLSAVPLRYEVRVSPKTSSPVWQVFSPSREPKLSLDVKPETYTIQVRLAAVKEPPLWSEWSKPYIIIMDRLSYIPEEAVVRPGDNVTVYCVSNDPSINASMAMWVLNHHSLVDSSLYHPISQWVSRLTYRASETVMYDVLKCTERWSIPYSKIYVEGGLINITCVTNGNLDAMDCRWKNEEWSRVIMKSKWSNLDCAVMEASEKAGEDVGELGPACSPTTSKQTCTIEPLMMSCYKLWLEISSGLGPVRSKPVYISVMDHVKPYPPTHVRALSQPGGLMNVSWQPPSLPVDGVQCQIRYHSVSVIEKWTVLDPVWEHWVVVDTPHMCQVYVIQVRCKAINGYWSEWTDSINSATLNHRAPEFGPDFWRIRQDDPYKNQSNITLLFEHSTESRDSYCSDGIIVQHKASDGSVLRKRMDVVSSYSFEWNLELQTVTVESYNSLGSSQHNMNMTLERQPRRRCMHSFHASIVNNTCVSLSWSLSDLSAVPLFMVVQWTPTRPQDAGDFGLSGKTWARLPYSKEPAFIRGVFFRSEKYGFHLYPVFADGEGEPIFTLAANENPAVSMVLMSVFFLCTVVFVTLVVSQRQMKKLVWKEVPNPNKCSWARGLDFKSMDPFEYLFRAQEGVQALPLPAEKISNVIIMDEALTKALVQTSLSPDFNTASMNCLLPGVDPEVDQSLERGSRCCSFPSQGVASEAFSTSGLSLNELQPTNALLDQSLENSNNLTHSSVIYSKVLLSGAKQDQLPIRLHYKAGSRSSSSDEGNFSANNSDTSKSCHSDMWELDNRCSADADNLRLSCSINSLEEFSDASEQDEGRVEQTKPLFYLQIRPPSVDIEDDEVETEHLEDGTLSQNHNSAELHALLSPEDSVGLDRLLSAPPKGLPSLYLPQYRTAQSTQKAMSQTLEIKS